MPLTKEEAKQVTKRFVHDYPGALALAYKFRDNTAQLYGPRAAEVPHDMKGGYISKETVHGDRIYQGRVEVPLENMMDARDLLLTLRHEVLGHYGANTFTPSEKRALLDGLIAASEEPSMKPLWEKIDRRYAESSLDVRAEEIFALSCESVAPSHHVGGDRVERGQQAYQQTCVAPTRRMNADDLENIACMVAQGIHDRSRVQQTFPALGQLFKQAGIVGPIEPAETERGRYSGKVIAVADGGFIQDVGGGKKVHHAESKVRGVANVGQVISVTYSQGVGKMEDRIRMSSRGLER